MWSWLADLPTRIKLAACWVPDPLALHPAAFQALDDFLSGRSFLSEFLWQFPMVKSAYIPAALCIGRAFAPAV